MGNKLSDDAELIKAILKEHHKIHDYIMDALQHAKDLIEKGFDNSPDDIVLMVEGNKYNIVKKKNQELYLLQDCNDLSDVSGPATSLKDSFFLWLEFDCLEE